MNRREFLVTLGAGALSLAGKNPPPRPTFCVELEVDSASIWVNGKRPDKAWVHDEGFYRLDLEAKNLVVAGMRIDSIKSDQNSCDDCYLQEGSDVTMVTSKGTFRGKLEKVVEPAAKIKLYNGEILDLNGEGQKYFRLRF